MPALLDTLKPRLGPFPEELGSSMVKWAGTHTVRTVWCNSKPLKPTAGRENHSHTYAMCAPPWKTSAGYLTLFWENCFPYLWVVICLLCTETGRYWTCLGTSGYILCCTVCTRNPSCGCGKAAMESWTGTLHSPGPATPPWFDGKCRPIYQLETFGGLHLYADVYGMICP